MVGLKRLAAWLGLSVAMGCGHQPATALPKPTPVWRVDDVPVLSTLELPTVEPVHVEPHPCEKLTLPDEAITCWEREEQAQLRAVLPPPGDDEEHGLFWSPGGRWFVHFRAGELVVVDAQDWTARYALALPKEAGRPRLAFTPDDAYLAAAWTNGGKLWSLRDGRADGSFSFGEGSVEALVAAPTVRRILLSRAKSGSTTGYLWNGKTTISLSPPARSEWKEGSFSPSTGDDRSRPSRETAEFAFSADGRLLVATKKKSYGRDASLEAWWLSDGGAEPWLRVASPSLPVALHPSGGWMAFAVVGAKREPKDKKRRSRTPDSYDAGALMVVSTKTREQTTIALTNECQPDALAFLPRGSLLAGASRSGKVCFWHLPSLRLVRKLERPAMRAGGMRFTRSGRYLVLPEGDGVGLHAVGRGRTIPQEPYDKLIALSPSLYELRRGTRITLLHLGDGDVMTAAQGRPDKDWTTALGTSALRFTRKSYHPTGQGSSTVNEVLVRPIGDEQVLARTFVDMNHGGMRASADGLRLAVQEPWRTHVLDTAGGEVLYDTGGRASAVSQVAFTVDDKEMVTATKHTFLRWDPRTLRILARWGSRAAYDDPVLTPSGTLMRMHGPRGETMKVVPWAKPSTPLQGVRGKGRDAFSRDGKWAAFGKGRTLWSGDGKLFDVTNRKAVADLATSLPDAVLFDPTSRWLAVYDRDAKKVVFVSADDPQKRAELELGDFKPYGFVFDHRGTLLAAASFSSKSIKIWNVRQRRVVHELEHGLAGVSLIAFDADAKRIALAASVGDPWERREVVRVLRIADGSTVATWELPSRATALTFASDGRLFVGGEDGAVRVYVLPAGAHVLTVLSDNDGVAGVAFNGKGRFAMIGDRERAARLWSCRVGDRVVPQALCRARFEDARIANSLVGAP